MTRTCLLILALAAPASSAERLTLVAGGGAGGDGSRATEAKLVQPFAVDFGDDGTVYFVEMVGGERLRAIDPAGVVRTLAGTGTKGNAGDGGSGLKASFNGMHHLAVGPGGVIYLADTFNNRVRTYDPKSGLVAAFAGTGERGYAGDGGLCEQAQFGGVYCLSFDERKEKLYVCDLDNRRVRVIDMKTRVVTTAAGNGQRGMPRDQANPLESPLVDPRAIAAAPGGHLYILERGGHALRVVNNNVGAIFTVVGTGKAGAALRSRPDSCELSGPKHLCVEPRGRAYAILIADTENHRVLRYTPMSEDPKVEVVAGTGRKGAGLAADPLKCELAQPHGVAVHPRTGAIYIADSSNDRILKIEK